MIIKFYHYSDFVTVEFSKNADVENADVDVDADVKNGYLKVPITECWQAEDTNNKGLTFNSQILSLSS